MIGTRNNCTIDDQSLSYIDDGTNESVVLFLHGWGGSAQSFQQLWGALREQGLNQRFIALDFPGFGESPPPSSSWGVGQYALCVVKYLEHMEFSTVHIISHSFGGRVATKLLATKPDLFTSATAIASAGIPSTKRSTGLVTSLVPVVKKMVQFPVLGTLLSPLRRLTYKLLGSEYLNSSGVMQETFAKVVEEDLSPHFKQITAPVTIIWGYNDSYVPVADAERMSREIPNATLHIFKDGRHGIHKTHAKQISEIIASTL